MDMLNRDSIINLITYYYKNSSGDTHILLRNILDTVYEMKYSKDNSDLSGVLYDYGIPDESALRFALDNYMKVITELSHGNLSKYNYDADFLMTTFKNRLTKYTAFRDTDDMPDNGRPIIFILNHRDKPCSGYYELSIDKFIDVINNESYEPDEVGYWIYE